jgi:hypothetical protein
MTSSNNKPTIKKRNLVIDAGDDDEMDKKKNYMTKKDFIDSQSIEL